MVHKTVTSRRMFYIPGYDPHPARRYRELYRTQSQRQGQISGYDIGLTPAQGDRYGWHVDATIDGHKIRSDIEVLVWADIVRDSMKTGMAATYWHLIWTAGLYIFTGALRRLARLRKGPILAALYPITALIAQAICAVAITVLIGWLFSLILPIFALFALPVFPAVLWWFKSIDHKLYAYYLMNDYAFSANFKGANPPKLEQRMSDFADIIVEALHTDTDEVLVVGHSSGAHVGISILADIIRDNRVPKDATLSFLSLGQAVPMVSFLPKADRLRGDLALLGSTDQLAWVDVTAMGDRCSFALCDPVAVTGVAHPDQKWPLVISAAFSQTIAPERWKSLKRKYFQVHFQYLCALDFPNAYDYFQITAGPISLGDRFAGHPPSPSMINAPTSKYTSVTP